MEGSLPNMTKQIYETPRVNIVLIAKEQNKSFPPYIRNKARKTIAIQYLEFLARAIRQKKKRHPYWKRTSITNSGCT